METKLSEEVLLEYGFKILDIKSIGPVTVYIKDKVEIAVKKSGETYYTNMGFDYPLNTVQDLKKLYKELRRVDLIKVI